MRPLLRLAIIGLIAALARPAAAAEVLVSSNDWHTGIAIARADLPAGVIPESADFAAAEWFEFGWGDAKYYPAPQPGVGDALQAALPGPAVMHMAGLPVHPALLFPTLDRVTLNLSGQTLARLVAFIDASFERRGTARAMPVAQGLYSFSLFYPAKGRFHLFNTCNTWTARALATAGLPLQVSGTQRAADVMGQLHALAR